MDGHSDQVVSSSAGRGCPAAGCDPVPEKGEKDEQRGPARRARKRNHQAQGAVAGKDLYLGEIVGSLTD